MSDDDWTAEQAEEMLLQELAQYDLTERETASEVDGALTVNWRELSDDQARQVWIDLRSWVEWFTLRYEISVSEVPNCWWKHGRLVEELSAMRAAHHALFSAEDAGLGPIGWHERLVIARSRLKDASSGLGCVSGHTPTRPVRDWSTVNDSADWDAWTSQAHGQ